MLGLTRQERGIVAFLVAGLVLGSLVTIYNRYLNPPELPEVDPAKVAAFDSISQRLAEEDRLGRKVSVAGAVPTGRQQGTRRESKAGPQGLPAPQSIEINNASETELVRLPGIGQVMARRIVLFRRQNGPFGRLEDLRKVRGIGPKVFEKISPYITLGQRRQ